MQFWKILLAQKILWELSFLMVYGSWPFEPSFWVKFKLLAKESGQKSNLVSISVVEIFYVLGFSVKRQKSLFTLLMTFKGYAKMAHWLATLRFLKIFSILTLKKTLKLEVLTLSLSTVTLNLKRFTLSLEKWP